MNVNSAVKEESSAEQCATFNIAHGHLDGAFTSLPNIVLAVIVGDNTILQHEPAWLPAWGMTDNLGTHKNLSCEISLSVIVYIMLLNCDQSQNDIQSFCFKVSVLN